MAIKKFSELPNRTDITPNPSLDTVRLVATSGTGDTAINLNITGEDMLSPAAKLSGDNVYTGSNAYEGELVYHGTELSTQLSSVQNAAANQAIAAVDAKLENYAVLVGGNDFTGDQTVEGNLTVFSVSTDGDYNANSMPISGGIPSLLEGNKVYDLGNISSSIDLSSIAFTAQSLFVQTCEIWLNVTAAGVVITWPTGSIWPGEAGQVASGDALAAGTAYRYVVRKEGSGNLIISLSYTYTL